MLDTHFHQGSGLHGFMPQADLRVLAMVSQDGATGAHGLETLWQVCASLQRLGYPVIVLDGTATETDHSPGLIHLLQQAPWLDGSGLAIDTSSLAVVPAARGLDRLCRTPTTTGPSPLQTLLPHFRTYGVLVLHAPADTLAPLLEHTHTHPLVVMGPGASGMLGSYRRMKQLVLDTGQPCLLAAVVRDSEGEEWQRAVTALHTMQNCADRHLPGLVRSTVVAANNPQDLQRLALQLLENAGTITNAEPSGTAPRTLIDTPVPFVRSH